MLFGKFCNSFIPSVSFFGLTFSARVEVREFIYCYQIGSEVQQELQRQKSFFYRGVHFWNGLKLTSKNGPSLFAFKRAIKQKTIQNSFLESLIRIYIFYVKDCNFVDTRI